MIKRIFVVMVMSFALLASGFTGVPTPALPERASVSASEQVATAGIQVPMALGRAVTVRNSLYSTVSVKMCTGHNGAGTCYKVPRNSKSPVRVKSVYAQRGCFTMVNATVIPGGRYWNSGLLSLSSAVTTIC